MTVYNASSINNELSKQTSSNSASSFPEVSHLGWGRWYTLRELEEAADGNVIGEGGYGIVYCGILGDNTPVAVKNLLNNSYVAPEYACTGMLNEKSDVYSFGILIMEIISGRNPVDYSWPKGEVNLVDWLKTMVGDRKSEEVVDPKLPEMPVSKALKRVLLVALRCVDPDAQKRPKMGHVIHMLKADDLLFRDERKGESSRSHRDYKEDSHAAPKLVNKQVSEVGFDTSEAGDSSRNHNQPTRWR